MEIIWIKFCMLLALLSRQSAVANIESRLLDTSANESYEADRRNLSSIVSIFSPRMDFDQWKPLTGRGDPLRQDPTYDYEPPLLERVHYWLDDTRNDREHFPERKSEVLMLGVSSRRPSLGSRMPPLIPRRQPRPPPPVKYEDFAYKISDGFPMTILVPPPPPPPLNVPQHFSRPEEKIPAQGRPALPTTPTLYSTKVTPVEEHITSSYALQEANLIYQSSSTNINNWILDLQNSTTPIPNRVSSDYSGWGPTTLIEDNDNIIINETHNFISNDYPKPNQPYTFYRPMLSEAPPPPQLTVMPFVPTVAPTFLPTTPPDTDYTYMTNNTKPIWPNEELANATSIDLQKYYDEPTTQKLTTYSPEIVTETATYAKPETTVFDMLSSMMSMPLVDGPDRPEDNLYGHASEHLQVFKKHPTENSLYIETMQTMQPPPPVKISESTAASHQNNLYRLKKPSLHTHDPYLHMRFTTPMPATTLTDLSSTVESTTPSTPMYLIIQGHSKVKTYSSKPDIEYNKKDIISNEIPKLNRTNEVKHLHTAKEHYKSDTKRKSKSHSDLKTLIEKGLGSIEIQETDLGIKYDVSDGSNVPIEVYKQGIVENDENAYSSKNKVILENRDKRQIDLEDLIPFDEDTIEEYVYNFLNSKKNSTGITGLLAQAVTSDAAGVVDELEDDDNESDEER